MASTAILLFVKKAPKVPKTPLSFSYLKILLYVTSKRHLLEVGEDAKGPLVRPKRPSKPSSKARRRVALGYLNLVREEK